MEKSLESQVGNRTNGAAGAAVLSAALGLFSLAVTQVVTHGSPQITTVVHNLGKLWMPGSEGIGPYSGKQTLALLAWLISWGILHYFWRKRELNLMIVGTLALALIGVATTLVWPPIYTALDH